jgi:pteridine reductase
MPKDESPVALITGGARRIGRTIAQHLHQLGYKLALHYRSSAKEALALCDQFNQQREDSAISLHADFTDIASLMQLPQQVYHHFGRLNLLINNASGFYATPLEQASEAQWEDLFSSNAKSAYFLTQQAATFLRQTRGSIINITDVHAQMPMRDYSIYCCAKASLSMLTRCLAKELAPHIRVNSIAPGTMLWPEDEQHSDVKLQEKIVNRNLLKRMGSPQDIANAVEYITIYAHYMTGQTVHVDGGRHLNAL